MKWPFRSDRVPQRTGKPARYVVCERPRGCGWFWEYREQRSWWRRRRWYFGPFFEDGKYIAPRWRREDGMQEDYADCWAHLVTTDRRPVWPLPWGRN